MKFKILLILIITIFISAFKKEANMKAPIAKKEEFSQEIHGQILKDEYAWMRDNDWPKQVTKPDAIEYLKQENAYFENFMGELSAAKDKIYEEIKARIKLADQSTYVKKDEYYYYNRIDADASYAVYCRKKGSINAQEEIILDVNELAKNKKFTNVGALSVSPDHKLVAYNVDHDGSEKYTIKVFNVKTKEYLSDEITDTIGAIVWHEEINGFFYLPCNENWRHDKIMFHKLGTDKAQDILVFQEKDTQYSVSIGKSSSKEYLFINSSGHENNEEYYFSMADHEFKPKLISKRSGKIEYSVDHGGNYFYIHTNKNADKFKLLRANDKSDISVESNWEEYIREITDKELANFDLTKNYLILNYKYNALPRIIIRTLSEDKNIEEKEQEINFPDEAYTAGAYSTNYKEDDLRVSYSSLNRPSSSYSYDYANNKLELIKQIEIPSGHEPEEYKVERIFAESFDGTRVPISLIYKKSLFKKDGSNPLYLYGYGSYGISMPPNYRNSIYPLLDRGFVYAIAHIRGGSDVNNDWYLQAKYLNKKKTFKDFIAVAEHLIQNNYTYKGGIAIMGGSAGGMLVGNVINNKPELFKLAIAHVPFVDVLNTMLDESLPLTPPEFKEWGNPKEKEYFDYMQSYSPYDNVKKQDYPHLLVTTGLSDPRVAYWEPAKWVARLRENNTSKNEIIFKTNMDTGHGGASGRFDSLKEAAEDIVFVLDRFNIDLAKLK